jgi:hypothetical protein
VSRLSLTQDEVELRRAFDPVPDNAEDPARGLRADVPRDG